MCGIYAEEVHCSLSSNVDSDMVCRRCLKSFRKAVNKEIERIEDEKLNGQEVREADASALKPK